MLAIELTQFSLHPAASSVIEQKVWQQSIRSRSCILTRRRGHDAPFLRALWADQAFLRSFHRLAPPLPTSDSDLERILNREYEGSIERLRALHWIVRTSNGEPWGLLSLTDLSLQHKRAEVLLGVLPGAPFGLPPAAMLMLFHFYFKAIKFNKLYSLVFADNQHSLKGTLHLGFKKEGVLRCHTFDPIRQEHVDVIQTGILSGEAFSPSNTRLINKLLRERAGELVG